MLSILAWVELFHFLMPKFKERGTIYRQGAILNDVTQERAGVRKCPFNTLGKSFEVAKLDFILINFVDHLILTLSPAGLPSEGHCLPG